LVLLLQAGTVDAWDLEEDDAEPDEEHVPDAAVSEVGTSKAPKVVNIVCDMCEDESKDRTHCQHCQRSFAVSVRYLGRGRPKSFQMGATNTRSQFIGFVVLGGNAILRLQWEDTLGSCF
jgi:hypothetical protein